MSFCPDCGDNTDAVSLQNGPCCDLEPIQESSPQVLPDQPHSSVIRRPLDEPDPPYHQPQPAIIKYVQKHIVLAEAPDALNRPDQPWEVSVEGDSIVARWKWEDPDWFKTQEVTADIRAFSYSVTLSDRGSWTDDSADRDRKPRFYKDGVRKNLRPALRELTAVTAERGVSTGPDDEVRTEPLAPADPEFDVAAIQKAIRSYLLSCGYRSMLIMPS